MKDGRCGDRGPVGGGMRYVNVNQNQMLASRHGVQGIPHVIFFDARGEEVESRTGMMTQGQMEDVLKRMGVSRKSE